MVPFTYLGVAFYYAAFDVQCSSTAEAYSLLDMLKCCRNMRQPVALFPEGTSNNGLGILSAVLPQGSLALDSRNSAFVGLKYGSQRQTFIPCYQPGKGFFYKLLRLCSRRYNIIQVHALSNEDKPNFAKEDWVNEGMEKISKLLKTQVLSFNREDKIEFEKFWELNH